MKTMTCKQMGGPDSCTMAFHGSNADEVIKAQDAHLKEVTANGDDTHKQAQDEMAARWADPKAGMEWYQKIQNDFAALPEDQA